jgi:putative acetyltransferase
LTALVEGAERAGIWTVQTGIFPENTASLALHHACGFRVVGVRERLGQLQGSWRDVLLLERRKPGSADSPAMRSGSEEGMNQLRIVVDDLSGSQIGAFLDEHIQEMRAITPLESKYALDLDELRAPEITFWSVLDGDAVVGCGALKRLDPDHAELKAMRVAATRRRGGIASLLLEHLIAEARRMGCTRLSLETGSAEFFPPARRLYERFGFTYCEPFAGYQSSPHNLFMTRAL